MGETIWVRVIGGMILLVPVVEILAGVAWETSGPVRRDARPGLFWFSVVCKLAVGVAILNIGNLRAVLGP